jgi:hypothetical protein
MDTEVLPGWSYELHLAAKTPPKGKLAAFRILAAQLLPQMATGGHITWLLKAQGFATLLLVQGEVVHGGVIFGVESVDEPQRGSGLVCDVLLLAVSTQRIGICAARERLDTSLPRRQR